VGAEADRLRKLLRSGAAEPDPAEGTPAAVMVPVLDLPTPELLFTVRSDQVRDHKGEISFPGGVRHAEDPDLLTTALRETEEELGVPRAAFDVLGGLPATHTVVSGYVIQPYVGLLAERPALTPSPVEIADVLQVEVDRLAEVERARESWFEYPVDDGRTVWGATGRILHEFLEIWKRAREE
jgi:8-oxo-dGTP pyrophosphatase MutT (NUDIX family)